MISEEESINKYYQTKHLHSPAGGLSLAPPFALQCWISFPLNGILHKFPKVGKWKSIQSPLRCHASYYPITKIEYLVETCCRERDPSWLPVSEEQSVMMQKVLQSFLAGAWGGSSCVLVDQEAEKGCEFEGSLHQGPPRVCGLPARLFQRCDNLPRQCPYSNHTDVCSHLIRIHPVLKTLQKSMSHMRKVVLMLPPQMKLLNIPLCFIPLHILR